MQGGNDYRELAEFIAHPAWQRDGALSCPFHCSGARYATVKEYNQHLSSEHGDQDADFFESWMDEESFHQYKGRGWIPGLLHKLMSRN